MKRLYYLAAFVLLLVGVIGYLLSQNTLPLFVFSTLSMLLSILGLSRLYRQDS